MLDEQFDLAIEETVQQLMLSMDYSTLDRFRPIERFILKKCMQSCGMKTLPEMVGDGERCSGECICEKCGHDFYHHPPEWRKVGYGNVPFAMALWSSFRKERDALASVLFFVAVIKRTASYCSVHTERRH